MLLEARTVYIFSPLQMLLLIFRQLYFKLLKYIVFSNFDLLSCFLEKDFISLSNFRDIPGCNFNTSLSFSDM